MERKHPLSNIDQFQLVCDIFQNSEKIGVHPNAVSLIYTQTAKAWAIHAGVVTARSWLFTASIAGNSLAHT
jgi:hypothetical protein